MNRDTHTDGAEQIKYHEANAPLCSKFRQTQNQQKQATHATVSETNKGVELARNDQFTYLGIRNSQDLDQSSQNKSFVPRSVSSTVDHHLLPSDGDPRRNLYVLGLPFDLTKSEFAKVFEPFGTVTHAVILATLDSASRRRGFVVMSTHQEAKTAMGALSRTQIKGHMLDVSWAVVQRSQGFLDGADRSMMLAISTPSSISEREGPFPIPGGNDRWELSHVPTSRLMVSNLSTVLFNQVSDLQPLFYPFGPIKDIKVLGTSHDSPLGTTIMAMVEYVNASDAQEAREALRRQSYAGHPIEAHYICETSTSPHARSSGSSFLSGPLLGHGKPADTGLNPFATPFNIDSRFFTGNRLYGHRYNTTIPNGLPDDGPLAPQPFPVHMRPYLIDAISRSSSATSSTWSHDGRSLTGKPLRASHSSVNRTNTYSSYV